MSTDPHERTTTVRSPSLRERGAGLAPLLIVLGIVAAAYVGAASFFGDRVAAGTKVGGVALGGMTQDEARARLQGAIDRQRRTPITIKGPDQTSYTIQPDQAGLAADADASIDGLIGFTLNPVDLWRHVSGQGQDLPLTVTSDRQALETAIAKGASSTIDTPAKEGSLTLTGAAVAYTAPVAGRSVDAAATAERILAGWPQSTAVTATTAERAPAVPASAFEAIKTSLADRIVAGPVVIQAGDQAFEVPAERLTPSVSFVAEAGKVTEKVDEKKLSDAVVALGRAKGVVKDAKDATVYFTGGGFGVRPAVTGRTLKADGIAAPVRAAWVSPTRRAAVPIVTTQPKLTTQEAQATLPKGLISGFTTHFPDNPVRTNNLRVAAARLNGTFVPKGATLSLNALLGKRTPDKGYKKAQVIYDGRLTYDYGGGISQVSTTLFNAAFFAGVRIDQHLPHSFYISRYPVGREATISWPDVDNRWTNTTAGGILIKAWLSGNDITVQFYGTKTFDVESVTGPRRNVVQPRTINDDSPTCVPQSPSEGFDITVTRVIKQGGAVVKRETYNTHYIPEDRVVCKTPYTPN